MSITSAISEVTVNPVDPTIESIVIEAILCDGTSEFFEFSPEDDIRCELENILSREDVQQCRTCITGSNGAFCCVTSDCKTNDADFIKSCGGFNPFAIGGRD